jgi:hypothetical protein
MAVINIKLIVNNISAVLEQFNQLKVYRSTTGLAGSYTELTDGGTRIALEAGQSTYDYTDTAGDPTYYYKSSYYNSTTTLESSLSDAQQGEGDPALDIISVEELKVNYLFGLDLTDDSGTEYPDSLYEFYIKSAVSWLEHKLDLPLRPKTITEELHDYIREDYERYIWLQLREYPVLSVDEIRMVLPGEQVVQTFDDNWIHVRKDVGQVQIVPGTAGASTILFAGSGAWLPYFHGGNRFVPDVFRVDYTAGFTEVPDVIRELVGKTAAYGPLNIAGDLLGGAGIASQSISIDGLSTNFNTTSSSTSAGYGARIIQYNREIKEQIPTIRRYYKGMGLTVV